MHKNFKPRPFPEGRARTPLRAADNDAATAGNGVPALPLEKGLGDALHEKFGPIGKAIHWPCLKGDGTTDLKPRSLCNYMRQTFNLIKL
jgi:hypothetical protein